ncbi:CofH family radical SAM protein [Williamwhitmania taraxaci]|uniref:De-hypoxanthine futalosine cyclase n=1 Tax=Williamwhitmania taraxaci TaxID=1640674 RepID=A0A1G6LZH0_9BACT|nr:CofH family radical SAM protein [Williamwhitmania taraxaci]SDC48611.1 de-hypoxanthine futalosine cyclase [Williamwhitmania taraxaci]
MSLDNIYQKAYSLEFLTAAEGMILLTTAPLSELMGLAHLIRLKKAHNYVTWQIDRKINITNICISGCKFCDSYSEPQSSMAYITTLEEYIEKVEELLKYGGEQLVLQSGLNPELGIEFYKSLFSELKDIFPRLKIHALGSPEIGFLAKMENLTYKQVLEQLVESGLDSLPGHGGEILCERVRLDLSPTRLDSSEWWAVMAEAHALRIGTSASIVFSQMESPHEQIEHLVKIRDLQSKKPLGAPGFEEFIPLVSGARLQTMPLAGQNLLQMPPEDYIRSVAISRIMLSNITNIQASYLSVGKEVAQACLHAGANDFGSIMLDDNPNIAGVKRMDAYDIQKAIADAGFEPKLRNRKYELLELPDCEFSRIMRFEELRTSPYNI